MLRPTGAVRGRILTLPPRLVRRRSAAVWGTQGTSRRDIRKSSNSSVSTRLAQAALLRLVFDTAALRGSASFGLNLGMFPVMVAESTCSENFAHDRALTHRHSEATSLEPTMKTLSKTAAGILMFLMALTFKPSILRAQGTAFTYQGRLNDAGTPANGVYDLQFSICNANAPGNVIAGPFTNAATGISNGLFTVTLDPGPGIFDGTPCTLEIGVRTNGGGSFNILSPRQPLRPAPYAIYAEGANAAGLSGSIPAVGLNGTYTGAVNFNNPNNSFSGNGAGLTNVNALALGGLTSSNFWQLGGNAVAPTQFIGSTNNQALELKVNGGRALRIEPNSSGAPNVIGGATVNAVGAGYVGSTIGGGGAVSYFGVLSYTNRIDADFGVIGGGNDNRIQSGAISSTISGGQQNIIQTNANYAAIGGGYLNTIGTNALFTSIGGGTFNGIQPNATYATVGGGTFNSVQYSAIDSTIGGGHFNVIQSNSLDSTIGGGSNNLVGPVVTSSTIAGGQHNTVQQSGINDTIGGGQYNTIPPFAQNSTISGGEYNTIQQGASEMDATIGGGGYNSIQGSSGSATIAGGSHNQSYDATIGGGTENMAIASGSTIAGGDQNFITDADESSIGGGANNTIMPRGGMGLQAQFCTIGGGYYNTNTGYCATIPGGIQNYAAADYSFAAGNRAKALQQGSFVWADSENADFSSTAQDQFAVRAAGGVQLADNTSLFFGSTTRQMLNLWGTSYGIGVQSYTTYFRCDGSSPGINGFAWYQGGTHSDQYQDPGNGGSKLMFLSRSGLTVYASMLDAAGLVARPEYFQVENSFETTNQYSLTVETGSFSVSGGNGFVPNYSLNVSGDGISFSADNALAEQTFMDLNNNGMTISGTYSSSCDRNVKAGFGAIDPKEILTRVVGLPIMRWHYTNSPTIPHLGPVAQDFFAAFGVGPDDKHITTVDEGGVALAAIQGLNQKVEDRAESSDARSRQWEQRTEELAAETAELREMLKRKDAENAEIRARLESLEHAIRSQQPPPQNENRR